MSKEDFGKGHDGSDNYDNVAVVETGSGRSDMRESNFMTRNGLNLESFKPREYFRCHNPWWGFWGKTEAFR
jgi:hypothetical protein